MEQWRVDEVSLERKTLTHRWDVFLLSCQAVDFIPAPSICEDLGVKASLRIHGCSKATLTQIPWVPTRVRFKAHRYLEERLFEVGGFKVEGDDLILWLASHANGVDTDSADGHINSFPDFNLNHK